MTTYYHTYILRFDEWGTFVKAYSSRELIRILSEDGWEVARVSGSHFQFRHPQKPGKVTVPHPRKSLPVKTVRSILKQAGIELLRES